MDEILEYLKEPKTFDEICRFLKVTAYDGFDIMEAYVDRGEVECFDRVYGIKGTPLKELLKREPDIVIPPRDYEEFLEDEWDGEYGPF